MNSRGETVGNQTMWIWIMFLIIIAAGGISIGVLIFYGYEYDSRLAESQIVSGLVSKCLSQEEINFAIQDDLYSKCGLNKKIMEQYNVTKVGVLICKENCQSGQVLFQLGSDFQACDFKGKNEKYQRCMRRFSQDKGGQNLEIVVSSNHLLRRVNS